MTLTVDERREARRRKILENSESRLARILNRTNDGAETAETDEAVKTATPHYVEHNLISSSRLGNISDNSFLDTEEDRLESTSLKFEEDQAESETYSFEYLRKYFAVLAVLVYFIVAKGGLFPSNSIFIPFFTLSVIKQSLAYRYTEPSTSLFIQILILYGLQPRFTMKVSKVVKICHDSLLDFCVYFFTFVLLHFTLETFFAS